MILTYDNHKLTYQGLEGYAAYTIHKVEWDEWDRSTYNDTSWQSTLVKTDSSGEVSISKASQFVNLGSTLNSFCSTNSLTSITINLEKHFKFNEATDLTTVQQVYANLTSSGVKANSNTLGFLVGGTSNKHITINGNGHILSGLYCYTTSSDNSGSFARISGNANNTLTIKDLTFDRCLFRSNAQASAGFSMISDGAKLTTYFVNFNRCGFANESTKNYQACAFGFLNANTNSTYEHIQTAFYCCGFKGSRSWSEYSCGDGGISNWATNPRFKSLWTDCTYISPIKLGGNGTFLLLGGNRANLTLNGSNTYYDVGTGITAQGTAASDTTNAINTFNGTTLASSRQEYQIVLVDGNLYHRIEV